jgi:thioredoxin 1
MQTQSYFFPALSDFGIIQKTLMQRLRVLEKKTAGGEELKRKQNKLILKTLIVIGIVSFLINTSCDQGGKKSDSEAQTSASKGNLEGQPTEKLPMLVDLGKGTCIPCKKMKPILEELEIEYKGKAIVKIIDLRYEPQEANKYKIRLIPTQIFFDAEGKEVFRHEGFMDKQSIKAKFAEMGVY